VPHVDVETVVVGAGHAGLAASWALAEGGLEHVVVEQGRIGETWRSGRWRSFRLNTCRWMSRLPGHPLAEAERDGYDTAEEFAEALAAHARDRRLPVRPGAGPASVRRADGGYAVQTAGETFATRNVIVATGFQTLPWRPAYAAALSPRLLQLDTATYRDAAELPDGGVLVAGGGQSGAQIAEDLAHAGRRVVLATSRVGRVPRRYRGRDALAWWTESGFYDRRRDEVDDAVLRTRQPLLSGNDDGHTLSLQLLHRLGVVLAGRVEAASGEEVRFDASAERNAAFGDQVSADLRRDIDAHIERRGIDAPPPEDDPADQPVDRLGRDAPESLRLDREGIATVIWCCGMRPRLDAVDPLRLGAEIEHVEGIAAERGLYLIGAPWLATRKSGIIWGAPEDAARIAAHIAVGRGGERGGAAGVT
jgi:putative flavoprotein involved in K+ transport